MHGNTYFLSDLHLLSRRSRADLHVPAIHAAAGRANAFILGGDIFDFRWSTLPSADEAVKHAIRWLDDLVASHPRCEFHFIQGYHDRIHHGPASGVQHVYFGHTHDALTNYRYRGVTFHNPGSPMPGLQFRILEVA